MKRIYTKPTIIMMELRQEEKLACCNNENFHGNGCNENWSHVHVHGNACVEILNNSGVTGS